MRIRQPRPLLMAAAAGVLIIAFVAVQVGRPAAGPAGGAGEAGLGLAAATPTMGGDDTSSLPAESGDPDSGSPATPTTSVSATKSATPTKPPVKPSPCPIFPASNVWNKDISKLPVARNSAAMVAAIGTSAYLHPDFDAIGDGIPYNSVTASTPKYTVRFQYVGESDAGPYPIPNGAKIEKGSDRHMLMLDRGTCRLYELYDVQKTGSTWHAGSGAIWNLRSNALRPAGWTSADAAGLPILPGLVLYAEVKSGVIRHAIRFTARATCGYVYPARHLTAGACSNLPPMGLRVRLKANFDISSFGAQARVVLTALKRYGMILADNGSPWFISGEPDTRWNDGQLHRLQTLTGADFEVVDTSRLRNG